MELIVDLHIHSHYSRATSREMNIEVLYKWAKIKGIDVLGTGDFTHPEWFSELRKKLTLAEDGLFKLKDEYAREQDASLPKSVKGKSVRFLLTVEISNIYKRGDRVRKLHNLVIAPSFEVVSQINEQLAKIGNLKADGRPILGLDSEELLKIALGVDPRVLFIPAHIWTPWFAMFGSKSGFDSLEEAFGKHAKDIYAVETGLSSDPLMNWRLSALDRLTLVSNSDAHSPAKLGREANVLNCQVSYQEIVEAIKSGDKRFLGTIEFFPEEGKYHWDGHSQCGVSMAPSESKKLNDLCSKCHRPLVLGVEHRVEELADRAEDFEPKQHKAVEYIVPLTEIIAEVKGVKSVFSKAVKDEYLTLISLFGDEFELLRRVSTQALVEAGYERLASAIKKMRTRDIFIEPGYDGVYGRVKIFAPGEEDTSSNQIGLGI